MAYMTRLGSFGFQNLEKMIEKMSGAGLGACELFSCGLKSSGIYMCRCALPFLPAYFVCPCIWYQ